MPRSLHHALLITAPLIFVFALSLPTARAQSEVAAGAPTHEHILEGALLAATLDYHRLYEEIGAGEPGLDPALAYDIFFDTAHKRLLRRRYPRTDGDLFWAQVPPRTGGRPLMPVARVIARNPARAVLISLASLPTSALLNVLRIRSSGHAVLVIEGLGQRLSLDADGGVGVEDAFETFLTEFLTNGKTVIIADETRQWLEVGPALKRMSTGFPDGTSLFNEWDCEGQLTVH